MISDEVASLRTLDHPNILKMHEFFEDEKRYYIVSDLYKGGELLEEIKLRGRFNEKDAIGLIK